MVGVQSCGLAGDANILKTLALKLPRKMKHMTLHPLLHAVLNNAHMKLTSKCMCVFINHSHPLEMFTNALVVS